MERCNARVGGRVRGLGGGARRLRPRPRRFRANVDRLGRLWRLAHRYAGPAAPHHARRSAAAQRNARRPPIPPRETARPPASLPKAPYGFAVDILAKDSSSRGCCAPPRTATFSSPKAAAAACWSLRGADDADTPPDVSVFAAGLDRPYGIAFYPPGPEPKFVYVATPGHGLSAIPTSPATWWRPARPKRSSALPDGGGHWTRDLAVSADGSTIYASVGSQLQRRRRA